MGCTVSKQEQAAIASASASKNNNVVATSSETHNTDDSAPSHVAKMDKLTSQAYSTSHPPNHWSDAVFLIPHEWLRHEMNAMEQSAAALPMDTNPEDAWKADLFAQWITTFFVKVIEMHHDNEEQIYMPFLLEKGAEIPNDKIAHDHEALIQELKKLDAVANDIVQKKGLHCGAAIANLKSKVPKLLQHLKEHLLEEETKMPGPIRANVTQEENTECINKLMQAGGIEGLHTELPGVMVAAQEWATDEFYPQFLHEIPPPMIQLANDIFIPNYRNIHCAKRDAPTMTTHPEWTEIPFDPSMLPPPPPPPKTSTRRNEDTPLLSGI